MFGSVIRSIGMKLLTENVQEILINYGIPKLIRSIDDRCSAGCGGRRRRWWWLNLQPGSKRVIQRCVDVFEHVRLMIRSAETRTTASPTGRRDCVCHSSNLNTPPRERNLAERFACLSLSLTCQYCCCCYTLFCVNNDWGEERKRDDYDDYSSNTLIWTSFCFS